MELPQNEECKKEYNSSLVKWGIITFTGNDMKNRKAETTTLTVEEKADHIVIDDKLARRRAKSMRLNAQPK